MTSKTDGLYNDYTYADTEIDPEQKSMDYTRSTDPIYSERIKQSIEKALQGDIVPYEEVFGEQ